MLDLSETLPRVTVIHKSRHVYPLGLVTWRSVAVEID